MLKKKEEGLFFSLFWLIPVPKVVNAGNLPESLRSEMTYQCFEEHVEKKKHAMS